MAAPKQMNFPHALLYARAGYPVRRSDWGAVWLVVTGGVFFLVSAGGRAVAVASDVSRADMLAGNWTLLGGVAFADNNFVCDAVEIAEPAGYPVDVEGLDFDAADFDVDDPGCVPVASGLVRPDRVDSTVGVLP